VRPKACPALTSRFPNLCNNGNHWTVYIDHGERRDTPSLMKTLKGVVPVAEPSLARHLPAWQRIPPWIGGVLINGPVGLSRGEVSRTHASRNNGRIAPNDDATPAGAPEFGLQQFPRRIIFLNLGSALSLRGVMRSNQETNKKKTSAEHFKRSTP
jgi:hypothetical protein